MDDGSTDDSAAAWSRRSRRRFALPVRYIHQANQGAYGARNTGIDAAGRIHGLLRQRRRVAAASPPGVPRGARAAQRRGLGVLRVRDRGPRERPILEPNCFYQGGRARPFMTLRQDVRGNLLNVINDAGAIRCQIDHGLFCGLQNSVLRRRVFERLRLEAETGTRPRISCSRFAHFRQASAWPTSIACTCATRCIRTTPPGTSKGMSLGEASPRVRAADCRLRTAGFRVPLTASERRSLRRRVGHDLFWHLGYNGYWTAGQRAEALRTFSLALRSWPWDIRRSGRPTLLAVLRTKLELDATLAEGRGQIMRVLYLTMNPNRESTTVPTEGWFRLLGERGLEPVLISNRSGAFQAWAQEQGVPCYEVPLPFPDRRRPWAFLRSLARVVRIGRRHRVGPGALQRARHLPDWPVRGAAAPGAGGDQRALHVARRVLTLGIWGARCPRRMFFVSREQPGGLSEPDVGPVVPESSRRRILSAYGSTWIDFQPDAALRAAFRREHGLGNLPVVGVACALRPRKQLEHLFQAAADADVPSMRVVLAGAGARETRYAETPGERVASCWAIA